MRSICSRNVVMPRRWPIGTGRQIRILRDPHACHRDASEASEGHARYRTLRLRSDFTFVGLCDLSELHPEKSADLGFMLMRRYWGQGLAQEAVTAVLAFAQQLGLSNRTRPRARG